MTARPRGIGARRTRVVLQTVRQVDRGGGRTARVVDDIATVWASIETSVEKASVQADQHHLRAEMEVETHFARRFTAARQAVIFGDTYDVLSVQDPNMLHQKLIFRLRARTVAD